MGLHDDGEPAVRTGPPVSAYETNRLFSTGWPTERERADARRVAKVAQQALDIFADALDDLEPACPACSGIGNACSCARTGAKAIALEL